MKVKARDMIFDKCLQMNSGRFYGKEIATLTIEEMRRVQSVVDRSWNVMKHSGYNEDAQSEYLELRRNLMKNLTQRGGV